MPISQQTRERINQGLLTTGVMASSVLFVYLLRSQVYQPLALLASGGVMLGVFLTVFAINPPTGQMRWIAWGFLTLFALGFMVAAAIMHWEV